MGNTPNGKAIDAEYLLDQLKKYDEKIATPALEEKINVENPNGKGSLSLNRYPDSTIGANSIAVGDNTSATGAASFAEGTRTIASNNSAHAEGYITNASGACAHAEGNNTKAKGANSHAEGQNTQTTAQNSHAEGTGTIASTTSQHVEGQYNKQDNTMAHILGWGSGDSESLRKNIHTIDTEGNAYFAGDITSGDVNLTEAISNIPTVVDTYSATSTDAISGKGVAAALLTLPSPMVFKGTLGTNGTIKALPTASAANTGYTYKVITDGTYRSIAAKVGDTFISDGSAWVLIPSGDEPSGTVTNVAISQGTGIEVTGSPITTSGTINIKNTGVTHVEEGSTVGAISITENGTQKSVAVNGLEDLAFTSRTATMGLSPAEGDKYDLGSNSKPYRSAYVNKVGLLNTNGTNSYGILDISKEGTEEQEGLTRLVLGNSIAKGNANNSTGRISLYNANGNYTRLFGHKGESNVDITFPEKSGTLALSDDIQIAQNITLTNEDLNTVKQAGFYNAATGNTCDNKPSGITYFGMLVIKDGTGDNYCTQIIEGSSGKQQIRYCRGADNWSNWEFLVPSSKEGVKNGTDVSLVTTGEKYTWNNKVDKVSGKGLSTNDLTATLKSNYDTAYTHSQSAHAPSDAQKNVQSDWNATSGDAFIKNKPTIPAAVTESTVSGWGFTKNTGTYNKPSGGIPKTDLASAVQTSLEKADSALQSFTETDPTVPTWAKADTKPSYTASEVGALPITGGALTGAVSATGNITRKSGSATYASLSVPTVGTTDKAGVGRITIGNSTAAGNDGNAAGQLLLYGSDVGFTKINPGYNGTSGITLTLPNKTGTVALQSEIPTIPAPVVYRGTCSTRSAAKQKIVTCDNFPSSYDELAVGSLLFVTFTGANAGPYTDGGSTLKINDLEEKSIYMNYNISTNAYAKKEVYQYSFWHTNTVIMFWYDGTDFIIENAYPFASSTNHGMMSINLYNKLSSLETKSVSGSQNSYNVSIDNTGTWIITASVYGPGFNSAWIVNTIPERSVIAPITISNGSYFTFSLSGSTVTIKQYGDNANYSRIRAFRF